MRCRTAPSCAPPPIPASVDDVEPSVDDDDEPSDRDDLPDRVPAPSRPAGHFTPAAFPRRITPSVLDALRRKRTGAGRRVRRPLRPADRDGTDDEYDDDDDGDDDDRDDRDDDDESLLGLLCCCCGVRCWMAVCMLGLAGVGWSMAITYGILRQPTYEEAVAPIRIAKQRWLGKTPQNAEEGFVLFDRNADGKIDIGDMRQVARITTGETPTRDELVAYIAKGDMDGDGKLDEAEYTALLHRERAAKADGKGGGKGG